MNWLLPVVGGFLLLAAWDGHRKGFIKKSVGIVTMVLTLIITGFAVPYCTAFFRDKTALYNVLQKGIASSEIDILETLEAIGLKEAMSSYLAETILQAVAFLVTLLLVGVFVQGIAFSLGIAAKLPVLHGINKLAGLLLGLAEGVFAVWVLFFVITVCYTTEWGGKLLVMIAENDILCWIYRSNLLFVFLR